MNSLKKSLSINSRRSSASSGVSIISEASPKTDWTSIYVGAAFAFIGSVQFNIFFASLLPYLEKVCYYDFNIFKQKINDNFLF